MELTDNDRQRIEQASLLYSGNHNLSNHLFNGFIKGAEYATIYERGQQAQQEIINNNIIEQLQIRVEQDIVKIKKLEDDAHDYSAWQSEYRASRAEVERLKARAEQFLKENRRLKKLNEYLESILTKKQDRTYEHYKVLTEHLDETED